MIHHFRIYKIILLIFDFLILCFSGILSYYIKLKTFLSNQELGMILVFILFSILIFYLLEMYNPWSNLSKIPIHYKSFIGIFFIIILYLVISFFLTKNHLFFESKIIFLLYISMITPSIFLIRYYFNKILDPENLKIKWLMLTNLEYALKFQEEINYRGGKWEIKYLLEEDSFHEYIKNKDKISLNVIGTLEKEFDKLFKEKWTGIIIATRNLDSEKINILIKQKRNSIPIFDLVYFYEYFFFKIPLYYIDNSWFLLTRGFMIIENPTIIKIKYIFDKIFSIILLITFLPIIIIVSLLIRIFDGAPIIYKQERLGLDNKPFIAYKFRTMIKDADKMNPYTQVKDRRVTKLGNFLRKTRLDEIPQLWNILKGEMSLIGPRAEWTKLTAIYEKEIKLYHIRHFIRPGLTGWAQVMYPYGDSIENTIHKLEYDFYYIKNYSLLLDLIILIKTIRVVVFGRGR